MELTELFSRLSLQYIIRNNGSYMNTKNFGENKIQSSPLSIEKNLTSVKMTIYSYVSILFRIRPNIIYHNVIQTHIFKVLYVEITQRTRYL